MGSGGLPLLAALPILAETFSQPFHTSCLGTSLSLSYVPLLLGPPSKDF
jgi:hypothetical protein